MDEGTRDKLELLERSCGELIDLMQHHDQDVREAAQDAARGLLWKWVDEGSLTELTNLLAAIRLLTQTILKGGGE